MKKQFSMITIGLIICFIPMYLYAELSRTLNVAIVPEVQFDTNTVHTKNLDVSDYGNYSKCVALTYDPSAQVDLISYLKGTWTESLKEILEWSIQSSASGGETWQEASVHTYGRPSSDEILAYYISVRVKDTDDISDRLILVVVAEDTATNYSNWLNQQTDTTWLEELPALYSSVQIPISSPEPATCSVQKWDDPETIDSYFHPGASVEIRSLATTNGHGHQACYDSSGNLITSGLGAGTADMEHCSDWLFGSTHWEQDVAPFIWAAQLDGNPVNSSGALDLWRNLSHPMLHKGNQLDSYLAARPTIANDKNPLNKGQCASE
jgi:hypothetical protein